MVTPETLMRQAAHTAEYYLDRAVEALDQKFGKGYARANPQLVTAFLQICDHDFELGMHYTTVVSAAATSASVPTAA